MSTLEQVRINFSNDSVGLLNFCLGFIMFGVALNLKKDNFISLINNKKAVFTGLASQFILLPAFTFLLIFLIKPHPGLALGMILVAACPGGNVSNFYSMVGKGNIALSVTLTAIATVVAAFATPFNFSFWGNLSPETSEIIKSIGLSFTDMFKTVFLILVFPLLLGLLVSSKAPKIAGMIEKPVKVISFVILMAFIAVATVDNLDVFKNYIHYVVALVLLHNLMALGIGYFTGKLFKNNEQDCRTISIETGVQNGGLALVLIFNFFDGNGPMALIAAWWGVWDIFSGYIIASLFAYRSKRSTNKSEQVIN
ncbi:BASS family bile acid:Na+ symporter [Roseivirga ehrenbergii]|uniref:Symporter n=1 Tax=Roseivirga ehrenbergii (strain DSM 102268 / JCM 13514 / KCTC 12282 / NCIMB 14502 / KMM 6017) TaxID=279360 RepID=A0A150X7A3_ROSEK|nr:bile acid:sodium symporter family protein [Roseivirga ehrenbergii]KYG74570.1 symporter [Roseivirga ehrenbergii]TCL14115.1 BASS family bile acid:Na+ symporter [Roseivirga ehrenbergii]